MGYETQLVIGVDTGQDFTDDGTYFRVEATINMCKMGNSEVFNLPWENTTDKNWYFYSPCGNGDKHVTEDRYGANAQPISIDDVIAALEADIKKEEYRRTRWALALLRAIKDSAGKEKFEVLLWGF